MRKKTNNKKTSIKKELKTLKATKKIVNNCNSPEKLEICYETFGKLNEEDTLFRKDYYYNDPSLAITSHSPFYSIQYCPKCHTEMSYTLDSSYFCPKCQMKIVYGVDGGSNSVYNYGHTETPTDKEIKNNANPYYTQDGRILSITHHISQGLEADLLVILISKKHESEVLMIEKVVSYKQVDDRLLLIFKMDETLYLLDGKFVEEYKAKQYVGIK